MKVKELIQELSKLKNQNADVNIIIGNEEDDLYSLWDIVLFSERDISENYIELFCNVGFSSED